MGLLDFAKGIFKRQPADENSSTMNLAFVLLSKPELPEPQNVSRSFASLTTNGEPLRLRENEESVDSECLLFEIGSESHAIVGLIPHAVPNREADEAVQFSLSAFGTGWTLPTHEAHLIVTFQSSLPQLDSLLLFTSVLAALVEASPAVGIYWGDAGATHNPEFFVAAVRDRAQAMLWNGVSRVNEPDGRVSLLSLGMKQLGLPDLWLTAPRDNETLGWFLDLLGYFAERGEPIPDGDTIGRTENEKIPVRYVRSPIDAGRKVLRLDVR